MNMVTEKQVELELEVRDYECDFQGIVNNAVYQNYLEHARHKFLQEKGIDFMELAQQGVNLVVIRAELDYTFPLKGGDRFVVRTAMTRETRLKIIFLQEIIKIPDLKTVLKAKIIGTALNHRGRPVMPPELDRWLEAFTLPS